jgi:pimeloyl-ACP methyl ester carboxylesterase
MAMILAAPAVAGEPTGVATDSDRDAATRPCVASPRQGLGGLEFRRPYERGKVPVVLIHGLWGTPHLWDPMIKDLEADPVIRGAYQFWTFRYVSGDSIPYSAHLLRQSLRQVRLAFDPHGTDAAFERMVVVGHSLGGILAKMMVHGSGSRLWQTVCDRPIDQVPGPPEDCQLLRQAFFYEPMREVYRVVFITTPHRGSALARGRLRELGTRLCGGPSRFRQAREVLLASNQADLFTPGFRGKLATSVDELAPANSLLMALCELGIDPSVRAHSIIADLRDPPGPGATDGIVPYSSSHLEGVDSELVVRGLHICLDHPAVIREVRRILVEHAGNDLHASDRSGGSLRPRERPATQGAESEEARIASITKG